MIKIENVETMGWGHAIRGMRNPKNSWDKIDSVYGTYWGEIDGHKCLDNEGFAIGDKDYKLMMTLRNAGTDHRKFMRMIIVYVDITAPLYWWKEFDTYKVGTVANSCSTMHKIQDKEFTLEDFSVERSDMLTQDVFLQHIIPVLENQRKLYLESKSEKAWNSMIQLLPSSYNQKRTVMLNYEVLANMYKSRKNHKLKEWRYFCTWIRDLPYSELITGEDDKNDNKN